jgi:purine-cytosine permease-like protein
VLHYADVDGIVGRVVLTGVFGMFGGTALFMIVGAACGLLTGSPRSGNEARGGGVPLRGQDGTRKDGMVMG